MPPGSPAGSRAERIDAARREWREGFVARAAVDFLAAPHRHSSGADHAGIMTMADFASCSAGYEPALTYEFRGHTIAKTGPWGQGPALLTVSPWSTCSARTTPPSGGP